MKFELEPKSPFLQSAFFGLLNFRANDSLLEILQKNFKDHYADIASARDNPGCSCVRRVSKLVETEPDKIYSSLLEFFNTNPSFQEEINAIVTSNRSINGIGKIFEIDATPEAFKDFSNDLIEKNYMFRSTSVVEKDGKFKIFLF